MMAEQTVQDRAYEVVKQGAEARRNGTSNPYQPASIHSMLHAQGWLTEDLRIALMKSKPSYAEQQKAFGQGLDALPAACG
jgi:hypothetical protein